MPVDPSRHSSHITSIEVSVVSLLFHASHILCVSVITVFQLACFQSLLAAGIWTWEERSCSSLDLCTEHYAYHSKSVVMGINVWWIFSQKRWLFDLALMVQRNVLCVPLNSWDGGGSYSKEDLGEKNCSYRTKEILIALAIKYKIHISHSNEDSRYIYILNCVGNILHSRPLKSSF